jgi:Tfp pilus assembly protein PilX
MHRLCSIRQEHGAALVISLLLLAVLFVVGTGALTTSRIETQIASSDMHGKQALLAAEYALAVGENTVQQAWSESDLADKLTRLSGRLYGKQQQPAWDTCLWDERDSIDVTAYFTDPIHRLPLPQMFQDPHARPRLMIERKHIEYDDLVVGKPRTGISYLNVTAHGARARWTALGNHQPDDKPGATHTQITYNERYPGTRIVIQSIYAVRYN